MKRHLLALPIGFFVFLLVLLCLPKIEYQMGRLEARIDIAQSKTKAKRCIDMCVQADFVREYESILLNEYNLEIIKVPPSFYQNEVYGERVRGYNDVQAEEFEDRYGKSVFAEIAQRAIENYSHKLSTEKE